MTDHDREVYALRYSLEPGILHERFVRADPVVHQCLSEYRAGRMGLTEALALAVSYLCEDKAKYLRELDRLAWLAPSPVIVVGQARKETSP